MRLVGDPGRTGFLTGNTRKRGPMMSYQVRFSNRTRFVPESQLEVVDDGSEDPIDLLQDGRIGTVDDLRQIVTHVRLTGRLSDLLYSLETTNTDFYAYQYKPVLKMLEAPNQGLLIADEVGLGKTIEAGLIWTELRSRFDFRRLMVLCPAMLREKWRRELSYRFGVDADVLKAETTHRQLEQAARQGTRSEFAIVASMQGLRPSKGSQASQNLDDFLREHEFDEPLIDFLIVDEAHYMKNPESKTSTLGHRLRRVASHVALLSATPIHLGSEDLFQLLHLLDEDTFQRQRTFDQILEANAPLVQARDAVLQNRVHGSDLEQMLKEARQHPLLRENRQLAGLLKEIPSDEHIEDHERRSRIAHRMERVNLLSHTVTRTRRRDVTEFRVVRNPHHEKIDLTDAETRFYEKVTRLVRDYCAQREAHEGFLLVMPQRQMSSSMPAALRSWKRRAAAYFGEQIYEDLGVTDLEIDEDDIGPLTKRLLRQAHELGDLETLWEDDSKYKRLRSELRAYADEHPEEKIVLFSYFRPTLDYLSERLEEDGFSTLVLKGGQGQDKDQVLDTFESPEGPQILLSSEVASEGVDLQFSRVLINYDLPWNPMRVEQRIGRIDRLGQEADQIQIWNLFCADTIDARIYERLFKRLEVFERALGNIEPILGGEIRDLTVDLLSGQLSPEEEEERIEQTAQALANLRQEEEKLEDEAAHLIAHGDYILSQVQASHDLHRWVTGEDIRAYVIDYIKSHYPGSEFQRISEEEEVYDIMLSNAAKHDLETYLQENPQRESTFLTAGDPKPVRCLFDRSVAERRNEHEEVINHLHPLVQFVSEEIDSSERGQHPVAAIRVEGDQLHMEVAPGSYVFTVQRWSVEGIQNQEKLDYQVATLQGGSNHELLDEERAEHLVVTAATEGSTWRTASNRVDLDRAATIAQNLCLPTSDERYQRFVTDVENRNEDLADTRLQTLNDHLENQRERLLEIRDEHERKGRSSLARATEGRIRKLENRVERRRLDIKDRKDITHRPEDICIGVIQVR